jgi:hypothetical protein
MADAVHELLISNPRSDDVAGDHGLGNDTCGA